MANCTKHSEAGKELSIRTTTFEFNEQVQQLLSAVGIDRQAYCSRGACEVWC
jgi:hypothetical protein